MRSFWLVSAVLPPMHGTVSVILAERVVAELTSPQKSPSLFKNGDGALGNPIKVHIPVREPSLLGSPSSEIQMPIS